MIELIKIGHFLSVDSPVDKELARGLIFHSGIKNKKNPYFALVVVGHLILIIWKA